MNQQFRQGPFHAGNPLANALVVIAGIIVISLSLTLGLFIFMGITGFLLITAAVVGVRNWWYRRTARTAPGANGERRHRSPDSRRIIEGEFREVRDQEPDREQR